MSEKKKSKKVKPGSGSIPLPNQAVSAYQESADPLGSYTGVTDDPIFPGRSMPRRDVGGKIYLHVDGQPVQDADDL